MENKRYWYYLIKIGASIFSFKIFNLLETFFEFLKTNMKNYTQKKLTQSMRIIEISIEKKKTDFINNKLKLPKHEKLQKLNPNGVMMDFDATSLYPSAMRDESLVFSQIESGFALKPHMKNC